jgi:hypothetical protein
MMFLLIRDKGEKYWRNLMKKLEKKFKNIEIKLKLQEKDF